MRGPEITLWKRHAIIVYRFQEGLSYGQISTKLNIDRKAIASLVQRTTARSRSLNLDDLQEAVAVQARSGRNKRAEPGDPLSQAVRDGVQRYDHYAPDRAANHHIYRRQVLGELDPNIRPLGNQQVYNILHQKEHCEQDPHQQQELSRKREFNRNQLSDENVDNRLAYCDEIERLQITTTMIICADEKPYDFGGTANHHITAPVGQTSYQSVAPIRFSIEQWAAACGNDCSITRPWHSWESKNAMEISKQFKRELQEANQLARSIVDEHRHNARIKGTEEHKHYTDENNRRFNAVQQHRSQGSFQGQGPISIDKLYPYQDLVPNDDGKKMNFVFYAFVILKPLLLPYWEALQQANPTKQVLIQEDNASPHLKARQLLQPDIQRLGVQFVIHPGNSPDLAPIEALQGDHQRLQSVQDFIYSTKDAKQATKDTAASLLRDTWQSHQFDKRVKGRASIAIYKELTRRCKYEQKGGNLMDDDVYIENE
jgi:hypothetical protein